jgi:ABC-type dipeptide/oligopeptide/nickel transport system permease subunit
MARAGDPDTIDPLVRLRPPSGAHLLDTDHLGRDVLSRLLHGGALTLGLATVALVGCLVIGTAAGAVAGRQPQVARLRYANVVLMIAGLFFLGLGAQPPTAEWGVMLSQAEPYLERAPHLVVAPGTAIVAVALSAIAFVAGWNAGSFDGGLVR